MDQACFAQLLHHNGDATHIIQVFGHIGAAWLKINKIRRVAENLADIIEEKLNPGLMGNRGQVQTCVG